MGAVLAWFRLDLRRRWRSLLVLALLIALASGTVLTTLAGAFRGASTVDRLLDQTLPATVEVLPNDPEFDWDVIRGLPNVAAVAETAWASYHVDGAPGEQLALPVSDQIMRTIERPVVLDGRLADPARPDEVVVTSGFVHTSGKGVGDFVTIALYEPETVDELWRNPDVIPDGPTVEAEIVGVVRSYLFGDSALETQGLVIPSTGLFAEYAPNLVGVSGAGAVFTGLVRLDGGGAAIQTFTADLATVTGRSDIDVWSHAGSVDFEQGIIGFEANALLAFAAAAGVAAVFLVGQAIARHTASAMAELEVLRSLGLTPRAGRWAAATGPFLAAVTGTLIGVVAAVIASRWFPFGAASWLEPAPGVDVDLRVLLPGLIGIPLLAGAGVLGAAWYAQRPAGSRRSAIAGGVARAGGPVPVVIGARFALEPGRGKHAIPVRPALIGAAVGVTGVLAALTFSNAIDDAIANPARYGQVHQLEAAIGFEGEDVVPAGDLLAAIAGDPDVVAVNDSRLAVARHAGVQMTVYSLEPIKSMIDATVTSGRLPSGPAEIVVAPFTAAEAGVAVGDTIVLSGTRATRELTVVGIGFVPEGELNYYNTGAWMAGPGYDDLFDGYLFRIAHIVVSESAEPAAVSARLQREAGVHVQPALERSPEAELRQIRQLPIFLAGFLTVLALGAVGHALATAVRRRRYDLAVLRALGMTRRQGRAVVVSQASILALIGVLLGVPLGVGLGRVLWRYYADIAHVHYVPPVAVLALVLAVPVALLAANLLAAWPGHRAASLRVSHVLRAE